MTEKLCITTYVSGKDYQEFIPVFIYSIYKSYPGYGVIIFCGETLADNVKKTLDALKPYISFKIVENHLSFEVGSLRKGVSSAAKRWLLCSELFDQYQNVYIGDVDIYILKESPSLLEQHLTHCDTIGLDYSNARRRTHYNRVTGLHFVKSQQYFSKMRPIIEKYTRLMKENKLVYEYDELMLYDMIIEADLGICPQVMRKESRQDPLKPVFRPTHGVHLAALRSLFVKKRRVCTDVFIQEMKDMKKGMREPLFRVIESNFESKMVKRIFRRIHNLTN